MKAIRYTAALLMMAVSAVSCIKEDAPYKNNNGVKKGMGILELDVNADVPEKTTKALHEVTDYPVIIKDDAGNTVREWNSVADVPDTVQLAVGRYVIESHTQGEIKKKMSAPYYSGTKDIEIVQYHTTEAEVICKMLNSKISVVYDPLFTETFKSWSITLNEGVNTVTTLTHTSDEAENVFYWYFQNNVSVIRMDFTGVTKEDDRTIHQTIEITKDKAEHGGYDNDKDTHFTGGDALTFTLKPIFDDKGEIGPITVIPSIDFTDDGNPDDFVVEVEDVTEGGEEGGEEGGNGDPANITLEVPEPMTLEFDGDGNCITDPAQGNVNIIATKGMKSLLVTIDSDNSDLMDILRGMGENDPSLALASGCEVVANNSLKDFLAELGQDITVPTEGNTHYTFPVGNFFAFLAITAGTHNFEMRVTDMEGAVKSETMTITVPGEDDGPSDEISLKVPEPLTLEFDEDGNCLTDQSLGNVSITATQGIKSLLVTIDSDNSDLMDILRGMGENDPSLALASGCEVVANNSLKNFLAELGQDIMVPAEGDTSYTFPVGNFFAFLAITAGTHNFEMKVTDMEGASVTETVVITVPNIWE